MLGILLTQSDTFIIGDVARLLGWIFNWIFNFLDGTFGIQNIGLCIILFTFIVNMLMIPLNIKQQRFSKLSVIMNPEIQAIQKKYKGKKDQDSMLKMQEETKLVHEKYGTSPTGGCLQLVIQMPILFALYRVVGNIPAYVGRVKLAYDSLVIGIMNTNGFQAIMEAIGKDKAISPTKFDYTQSNTIIDVLYKFNNSDWENLMDKFPNLADVITETSDKMKHMNSFLGGLSIAEAPINNLLSIAILIPILAGLSQWINTKLMPTNPSTGDDSNPMANSMKSMNIMMPMMSAVFSFTLPIGMGLYWIAGSVFRCIQQLIINKYMDSIDMDQLIKSNVEKANKKREKKGLPPQKMSSLAKVNTRNIEDTKKDIKKDTSENKDEDIKKNTEYYNENSNAKKGSLASKANMVRQYNEKKNK